MKFAIYNTLGEIQYTGMCADDMISVQHVPEGCFLYQGPAEFNDLIDMTTHELIEGGKPDRPSEYHDWDPVARAWVGNKARLVASKSLALELERDVRINAPITYDGKVIDGFKRSQENIASKLATITQREALGLPDMPGPLLVWRDAANVTHTFPDQATYKAWLSGLAIALEERGTMAYAWSWAKKAELQGLATFAEVEAFTY